MDLLKRIRRASLDLGVGALGLIFFILFFRLGDLKFWEKSRFSMGSGVKIPPLRVDVSGHSTRRIQSMSLRTMPISKALIVWNVGQGQWVSWVEENHCYHFDQGGEKAPWKKVMALCGARVNSLLLSHGDWDHMNFVQRYHLQLKSRNLPFCLQEGPLGIPELLSCGKDSGFSIPTSISNPSFYPYQIIHQGSSILRDRPGRLRNQGSWVYLTAQGRVLIPGDSPQKMEGVWGQKVHGFSIQGLILGHHGSQTSTSLKLLGKLPGLHWAVASARQAKYGHPHKRVMMRLKIRQIPLLRTEDWGNLIFVYP